MRIETVIEREEDGREREICERAGEELRSRPGIGAVAGAVAGIETETVVVIGVADARDVGIDTRMESFARGMVSASV
jgi:hypothetical protein